MHDTLVELLNDPINKRKVKVHLSTIEADFTIAELCRDMSSKNLKTSEIAILTEDKDMLLCRGQIFNSRW